MGLASILGCAASTNGLQEMYDPIRAMRMPQNPAKAKKVINPVPMETKDQEDPREIIDISALSKMKESSIQKYIQVTSNKTILRKGPGSRFEKSGTADKNKTFKHLRTIPGPKEEPSWHWVEDDTKNKFFISSQHSEVLTKREDSDQKISIHKGEPLTPSKFRKVLNPAPPLPQELRKLKNITLNFEGTEVYDVMKKGNIALN